MAETLTSDKGWIYSKPEPVDQQQLLRDIHRTQKEIRAEFDTLASEIWSLKGALETLTKTLIE